MEGVDWGGLPQGDFYATFWAYGKWWWADLRIENAMLVAQSNHRLGHATEAEARQACCEFAALPRAEQKKLLLWPS
jgi:hypothetical protein